MFGIFKGMFSPSEASDSSLCDLCGQEMEGGSVGRCDDCSHRHEREMAAADDDSIDLMGSHWADLHDHHANQDSE